MESTAKHHLIAKICYENLLKPSSFIWQGIRGSGQVLIKDAVMISLEVNSPSVEPSKKPNCCCYLMLLLCNVIIQISYYSHKVKSQRRSTDSCKNAGIKESLVLREAEVGLRQASFASSQQKCLAPVSQLQIQGDIFAANDVK